MEKADFEPLIGRIFEIKLDGKTVGHCRLEAIFDYNASGLPNTRTEPFGLDFFSENQEPLPQNVVTARCEGIDEFQLNLIPASRDEKGIVYHSVFN